MDKTTRKEGHGAAASEEHSAPQKPLDWAVKGVKVAAFLLHILFLVSTVAFNAQASTGWNACVGRTSHSFMTPTLHNPVHAGVSRLAEEP